MNVLDRVDEVGLAEDDIEVICPSRSIHYRLVDRCVKVCSNKAGA